jgi:hypothetical protein
VAALDAAHVASRAELLAPETGRVGEVVNRQLRAVENLFAVHVGDRDFGRWNPPQPGFLVAVERIAELRQIAGADERGLAHHDGRIDLGEARGPPMHIEEPGDQCPLQARAGPAQQVETRP